jgi:PAS domain S-box-containing protein
VDIFALMVETVSDIVTLLSREGDVLYQSPSISRVLGYRQEDRVGRNIFADVMVHPEDVERKKSFLADTFTMPQAKAEFRLRHVDGSWRDMEAVGVHVPALGGAVATYRDITQQRRREVRQNLLAEAGKRLSGSMYTEATLVRLARLAVPDIADWCIVDLIQDDGTMRHVITVNLDPAKERWAQETAREFLQERAEAAAPLLESGEARLVPEISPQALQAAARTPEELELLRNMDFHSVINVPLIARGRPVGVMTFVTGSARTLDQEDLAFARELGTRAALSIDNTRLYQLAETARLHLQDLFMEAPAFICVTRGPDHVFELVNPLMRQILGHRDLVGETAKAALPDLEQQGLLAITDRVFRTGETFVGREMPVQIDRDGDGAKEHGYFNFVIQPTRDVEGCVDGVMVHGVEVTDQVSNRQRVESLAAERSAILTQMAEGVVIVDRNGMVTFMNDAAERMYGTRIIGFNIRELPQAMLIRDLAGRTIDPKDTPLVRALDRGETVIDAEVRIKRSDGREVVLQRAAAPVMGEDSSALGAVMTVRDVTSERTLEMQKDEFLSAIAHDLKTPLTAIKGHSQVLLRRMERADENAGGDSSFESVARIDATASRMTALVNELLDITRADMQRPLKLVRTKTDLVQLVRDVIVDQGHAARRRDIRITARPDVITGMWDAPRLRRAVSNLVTNALRYGAEDRPVTIRLSQYSGDGGEEAVVEVQDHGMGIPAADLPHIFDRFFRGSNVSTSTSGTGLGLTSARQIVEQHGGSLTVESTEGKGTRASIRLPIASTVRPRRDAVAEDLLSGSQAAE